MNHQTTPVHQHSSATDIIEVKSKIIQARVRNLALKRAIVQRSLATSGNGVQNNIVRTQSASSSRSDLAVSVDTASPDAPLPDAISELEAQLKKLKGKVTSSHTQEGKEEESDEFNKELKKDKLKKPRRASMKEDAMPNKHPDVPMLPLKKSKKSVTTKHKNDNYDDVEEEFDQEQEEEEEVKEEKRPKRKPKKSKKQRLNAEKQAKEDEALAKSIDKIMGEVDNEIETNDSILEKEKKVVTSRVEGGLNAPLDSFRMKELRRNEERKKRAEARDKIDSLLNNENLEFKIPRWKHELNGNKDPKPELVLKGKSLFRMAARVVLYFYAKPIVRVRIMRIMGRNQLKEDLTKATLLSLDTCASWLTSTTKVPITSIVQVGVSVISILFCWYSASLYFTVAYATGTVCRIKR